MLTMDAKVSIVAFVMGFGVSLLLVSRYQAIVASNEVSPGLADQLKALEDRMKSEIQGLKKKVSDLELELSGLKSQPHTENKRQLPINEQEVAFSARVGSPIKGLGTDQTIVFSDVRTNIGNRYNPATGVFHVDVTGTYLLFANILSEPGHSIETEIVVDGSSKLSFYSGGAANFNGPGSNMVILKLTQGQDVWVKVNGHFSTNMAVHCCWSTFSGYLLRPTDSEIDVVG